MPNLKNRVDALEASAKSKEPVEPVPVLFLPEDEAEVSRLQAEGKQVIVFTTKDARKDG